MCTRCSCWYVGGSQVCKWCRVPLKQIVYPHNLIPLPHSPHPIQEIIPCPKCQTEQSQPGKFFCDYCGRMLKVSFGYVDSTTTRPTITIQLRNGDKRMGYLALIDSGAEVTLFHGFIATALGIDMSQVQPMPPMSVGGVTFTPFDAPIEIGLLGKFYQTRAQFAYDYPVTMPGLLGHYGFSDRFDFHSKNSIRQVTIEPLDVLREKQYRFCPNCSAERKDALSRFCYQCGTPLIVPTLVSNGYLPQQVPIHTTGQPFTPLPIHTYQVASTMQVQPGQAIQPTIIPLSSSVLGEDIITKKPVTITQVDRLGGTYVIGKTGSGKTTLLVNMILQDIEQGMGVCFFDTHGDAIMDILRRFPANRDENDVILLDLLDPDYAFGLNLFHCANPQNKEEVSRITSTVVDVFAKLFTESGDLFKEAPNMAETLQNVIPVLLSHQNPQMTMAEIPLLVSDEEARANLLKPLRNRQVQLFWNMYNRWRHDRQEELTSSTRRRVGNFLNDSLILEIVGQSETTIDFRSIMDKGKILLVKLSRKHPLITSLVGSVIVGQIANAAYSREDTPEDQRRQFNLYADEYQRFSTPTFAELLAEVRKYKIATCVSHQFRDQLDYANRGATLNVRNLIVYEVSGKDAEELAQEFAAKQTTPLETRYEAVRTPVMEPIQYMTTHGVHPLEHTRTFMERYGKNLVEQVKLEAELDRDSRHEMQRYLHDVDAGVRYIAPPLIQTTNESRVTLQWVNGLFYQAMLAGKEGKNPDDIPLPYGLVNYFIRALVPEKRGFLDAMAAYDQYQYSTGLQVTDLTARLWELRNRLASLPAHRQTEIIPLQAAYTAAKQQREQFFRQLLSGELTGVREHCIIVKKGSAYYSAVPEQPSWNGTPPQASYFLRKDTHNTPPIRFAQIPQNGLNWNFTLRDVAPHRIEFLPCSSWEDAVIFYCQAFGHVWFRVEPTLHDRNWWQQQRSLVRVQYDTHTYNRGNYGLVDQIEELEVWTLKPGIEQTWYITSMFEAELSNRLGGGNAELLDFLPNQLRDGWGKSHLEFGKAQLELQEVTNEIAAEVARETQQIQSELPLLEQIEATKPAYETFVPEFEEQMRQIMRELAVAPVEEASGLMKEIPIARPISDLENEVAKLLTNPQSFTARTKLATGEHTIKALPFRIPDAPAAVAGRLERIRANTRNTSCKKRADVDTEIAERQAQLIISPKPTSQIKHEEEI